MKFVEVININQFITSSMLVFDLWFHSVVDKSSLLFCGVSPPKISSVQSMLNSSSSNEQWYVYRHIETIQQTLHVSNQKGMNDLICLLCAKGLHYWPTSMRLFNNICLLVYCGMYAHEYWAEILMLGQGQACWDVVVLFVWHELSTHKRKACTTFCVIWNKAKPTPSMLDALDTGNELGKSRFTWLIFWAVSRFNFRKSL